MNVFDVEIGYNNTLPYTLNDNGSIVNLSVMSDEITINNATALLTITADEVGPIDTVNLTTDHTDTLSIRMTEILNVVDDIDITDDANLLEVNEEAQVGCINHW